MAEPFLTTLVLLPIAKKLADKGVGALFEEEIKAHNDAMKKLQQAEADIMLSEKDAKVFLEKNAEIHGLAQAVSPDMVSKGLELQKKLMDKIAKLHAAVDFFDSATTRFVTFVETKLGKVGGDIVFKSKAYKNFKKKCKEKRDKLVEKLKHVSEILNEVRQQVRELQAAMKKQELADKSAKNLEPAKVKKSTRATLVAVVFKALDIAARKNKDLARAKKDYLAAIKKIDSAEQGVAATNDDINKFMAKHAILTRGSRIVPKALVDQGIALNNTLNKKLKKLAASIKYFEKGVSDLVELIEKKLSQNDTVSELIKSPKYAAFKKQCASKLKSMLTLLEKGIKLLEKLQVKLKSLQAIKQDPKLIASFNKDRAKHKLEHETIAKQIQAPRLDDNT